MHVLLPPHRAPNQSSNRRDKEILNLPGADENYKDVKQKTERCNF